MESSTSKREVELDDKKLMEWALQKEEIVLKGRNLSKEAEELAKKHEKVAEEIRKTAEELSYLKAKKIIPRTKKIAEPLLGEYEIPITTKVVKDKLMLEIEDVLVEFKETFAKQDKFAVALPGKKDKGSKKQ